MMELADCTDMTFWIPTYEAEIELIRKAHVTSPLYGEMKEHGLANTLAASRSRISAKFSIEQFTPCEIQDAYLGRGLLRSNQVNRSVQ